MSPKTISFILLFFFLFVSSWSLAQDIQQDDPYKKPQIWKKIKANPNDSTLWALYLGKKWTAMTANDKEEIANWKQELYIQSIAEKEAIYGAREKDDVDLFKETPPKAATSAGTNTSARPVKSATEMKQILAMESMIMQERSDIAKLKQNIYENFVIIEDMLREEFAAFNVNYRYYDDVHADGKYSEIKWIEEQEARLKKLKQEKVASLKKQAGIK